MVFELDDDLWFPHPSLGESDGLVAVGGDLSLDRLRLAYSNGFFPWFAFKQTPDIEWFCPMQRCVIFPSEIHISHSMHTLINKQCYRVSFNVDFEGVMRGCATVNQRDKHPLAWLSNDIIEAYTAIKRDGWALSVEVWDGAEGSALVGGLYGVLVNGAVVGESMFSLKPSTSKLALISLALRMQELGGTIIDCQLPTPHLLSMGARMIPYERYMEILEAGFVV